jgi:hypothetical protein
MDKDDILRMVQEAHFHLDNVDDEYKKFERFAHLVAAHERTKISASIKQIHDWYSHAGDRNNL